MVWEWSSQTLPSPDGCHQAVCSKPRTQSQRSLPIRQLPLRIRIPTHPLVHQGPHANPSYQQLSYPALTLVLRSWTTMPEVKMSCICSRATSCECSKSTIIGELSTCRPVLTCAGVIVSRRTMASEVGYRRGSSASNRPTAPLPVHPSPPRRSANGRKMSRRAQPMAATSWPV